MSRGSYRPSSGEALCCCEYVNEHRETGHILACCCDCEAVDTAFDRCLTCKKVSDSELDRMFSTIEDRCRIPWCSGGGAVRLKLDKVVPIILIPGGILLATLGQLMTYIVMVTLPIALLMFYRFWSRKLKRNRTQLFYTWTMVSVLQMYYTFEFIVLVFREVLFWENLVLSCLFGAMMWCLYLARRDPGTISRNSSVDFNDPSQKQYILDPDKQITNQSSPNEQQMQNRYLQNKNIADSQLDSLLGGKASTASTVDIPRNNSMGSLQPKRNIPVAQVTWLDSRPIKEGYLQTWCGKCRLMKPPRSGHCPVCNVCIQGRDHHCVWIDQCIGLNNHRAFYCGMLLFILCGCYGTHLTLTTVCTPEMVYDFFLLPFDCNFVYTNFLSAMGYVSAIYTLIAVCAMCCMCIIQTIQISFNVTSLELHQAGKRSWLHLGFFPRNNFNNKGVLRNWAEFLTGRRRFHQPYSMGSYNGQTIQPV